MDPVVIDKISYIESLQKKTWFYVEKEQFKTSITLKELQMRLPPFFIRIHRSYIVNIHFIKKMARDLTSNFIVTLKDGTELPVSQSYLNNLRNALEF
ncbi:Transcriptional regulatory protein YpdB OS=Lysinibacillus sphaericus OX=1421 GN=ypdB_3 PE=4 SV=1 [Lysinibacillus sphaericus]